MEKGDKDHFVFVFPLHAAATLALPMVSALAQYVIVFPKWIRNKQILTGCSSVAHY